MEARLCELGERENAGRKRAQVYPLRYSEHVFSRRRRNLVAQRAAAQGIFEMASKTPRELFPGALTTCQSERYNRKEQLSGSGFILSPLFMVKAHLVGVPSPRIFETLGNP